MARKKTNLAYITNDSARKSTFNKRKKGLLKKINELSVLCGIEACAVIYNPVTSNPEVWPTNSEVKNTVERFEMLAKLEQEKKMVNHEDFIRQSIMKTMENNNNKVKDNMEMAAKELMFLFLGGKGNNLMLDEKPREALCKFIDKYVDELYHHKTEIISQSRLEYGESSSSSVNVMPPPSTTITELGSSSFFPDVFNSSHQLGNELWGLNPEQVNTFGNNFLHAPSEQQGNFQMINPGDVCNQHPNVAHNEVYNPTRQEEWSVDEMMMNNP